MSCMDFYLESTEELPWFASPSVDTSYGSLEAMPGRPTDDTGEVRDSVSSAG